MEGNQFPQSGAGQVINPRKVQQHLGTELLVHQTEEFVAYFLDDGLVENLAVFELDDQDVTLLQHLQSI